MKRCRRSKWVRAATLAPLIASLVLFGCNGSHLHKIQVQEKSGHADPSEFVLKVSRPVLDELSHHEFHCRTDYGHALFYAACTRNDHSGIGQTTDTFVNISHPSLDGVIEISITTSQLSYHPATRAFRKDFAQWRDMLLAVIESVPDISYSDYEVD
jgi:hypothetical protein